MADIFISYKNTPERKLIVRRMAAVLKAYNLSVWWDYGLEAGQKYARQIEQEIAVSRVVVPLWCEKSIESEWVLKEARLGGNKLLPARLQNVPPPDEFESIQAANLINWDGTPHHPDMVAFVRLVSDVLNQPVRPSSDLLDELSALPKIKRLPVVRVHSRAREQRGEPRYWSAVLKSFFLFYSACGVVLLPLGGLKEAADWRKFEYTASRGRDAQATIDRVYVSKHDDKNNPAKYAARLTWSLPNSSERSDAVEISEKLYRKILSQPVSADRRLMVRYLPDDVRAEPVIPEDLEFRRNQFQNFLFILLPVWFLLSAFGAFYFWRRKRLTGHVLG